MTNFSFVRSMAFALAALLLLPAAAQSQTKAQQKCVNSMNKSGVKVAKAQSKENVGCIKAAKAGAVGDVDDCITADADGKVDKAKGKTVTKEAKTCKSPFPPFGFTGSTTTNNAAVEEEINLFHSIFGEPADPAFSPGNDKCQEAAAKAFERIAAESLGAFIDCKKDGLKSGTITNASSLAACIGLPNDKVAKADAKLGATLSKYCFFVSSLYANFPGCVVSTPAELTACMSTAAKCRACLTARKMDGLSASCDAIDNGVLDGTCPQCGNSNVDPGEECDTAGQSATCDADCTFPVCGDRVLNTLAGEACEDGNTSNGDCCDSVCQFEPNGSPCNDNSICTVPDTCNGAGSCSGPAEPALSCVSPQEAGGASLKLRDKGSKDKLIWKWGKGAADLADYGSPQSHGFTLCVYNQTVPLGPSTMFGRYRLRADSSLWKTLPKDKGYKYKDKTLSPDGVRNGSLKPGAGTKAKVKVKAKGSRLGFSPLSISGLTVQLRRSSPDPDPGTAPCYSASFFTDFKRNDSEQFKDKSD